MANNQKQEKTLIREAQANTLLADLLKDKGFIASEEPSATPSSGKPALSTVGLSSAGKIVLRRERKGRGGKTVTVVSGLALPPGKLEELAREMRKGLGCGSTVEQGTIVLQGDIALRVADWLKKKGASRVVL